MVTVMFYREYPSSAICAPFVSCYWHLRARTEGAWESIYPDGCTELVFKLSGPADELRGRQVVRQPSYFVYGQIDRSIQVRSSLETEVLAIRLKPWGARPLLSVPGEAIAGRAISLDSVAPQLGRRLVAIAEAAIPVGQKVARFGDCLERWIRRRELEVPATASVARFLQRRPGSTVADSRRLTGWSERTTQRRFREDIGLSPKRFLQICRFLRFTHLVDLEPEASLCDLAVAAGYYDQPHLHRDLRRFTGKTPASYRSGSQETYGPLYGQERLSQLIGL